MSTTDISVFPETEASTQAACPDEDGGGDVGASQLPTWQGYMMFAGLAVVAFGVARGSLAVRNRIYQDKVRLYDIKIVKVGLVCSPKRKLRFPGHQISWVSECE